MMFGKRRKNSRVKFPRFYYESLQGRLKARIGQDITKEGEVEVIIEFLFREDSWKWKSAGRFRYLDICEIRKLLDESDKYVRGMLTAG